MPRRSSAGFTLVELMITVAILGVLTAVAIPTFMRYVKKSRSVEAVQNIRRMYEGARAYYLGSQLTRGETRQTLDYQFPASHGPNPAVSCCLNPGGKCPADPVLWDLPTWSSLTFQISDPFYFQYEFVSSGTGADAMFTARALGDLDCDTRKSTFEMVAKSRGRHDTVGSGGIYRNLELE
jgi:prepilin-type N-terminal cleavage/methylation domain-containing protein